MLRKLENILVTGGAGFIGSNFIHYVFKNTYFCGKIINVDKLTFAGNLESLQEIEDNFRGKRYFLRRQISVIFRRLKRYLRNMISIQ